jgi:hypothetical protein
MTCCEAGVMYFHVLLRDDVFHPFSADDAQGNLRGWMVITSPFTLTIIHHMDILKVKLYVGVVTI